MRHELIHAFLYISIHAPTRGATKWIPCCGQSAHISIHAPARGATNSASMMSALSLFQSTLPQGERLPESHHFRKLDGISIHAPTRGATPFHQTNTIRLLFQSTLPQGERHKHTTAVCQLRGFQSTLPQGERLPGSVLILSIWRFQSTLPQGERRLSIKVSATSLYFNPRSHKGSDSNFTQNSISVLFHFYQSFPHIIFPHTARFRLLIIFCTFFLVRIAQRFPVCFHFAPKQYPAFYNVCSTDLL